MGRVYLFRNDYGILNLIVVRNSKAPYVYLFTLHPYSDMPAFNSIPYIDIFPNLDNAMDVVKEQFGGKPIFTAIGLIGFINENNKIIFGFITDDMQCAQLPGNNEVRMIKKIEFLECSINGYQQTNIFDSFQIADLHYYSDTLDLTRLFPSFELVANPDSEFCWNFRWREPFVKTQSEEACITMVQGYIVSQVFKGHHIAYIVRRSVRNPGTRYAARGLNDANEPANECECELIFTDPNGRLWSHAWRRGSVPIKWMSVLSLSSKVQHIVGKTDLKDTENYFRRINRRFNGDKTFCLSLIRSDGKSSEEEIYQNFRSTINQLRTLDIVRFIELDLNSLIEDKGEKAAADEVFRKVAPLAALADFSYSENAFDQCYLKKDLVFKTRQMATVRFNCIDSLDRTNMATFFYAVVLTAELCRRSGLSKQTAESFSPINPVSYIPEDIVEFLSQAFIASGDAISYLYTNTAAIKSAIIRQYSRMNIEKTSSDAVVSIKRRYNNIIEDPIKQKAIELFTQTPSPSRFFVSNLLSTFLSIGFPSEIINLSGEMNMVLSNIKTFRVLMPVGFRLTALYIYCLPAERLEVAGAVCVSGSNNGTDFSLVMPITLIPRVSEPTCLRIPSNGGFFRILMISFFGKAKKLFYGKIGFECTKEPFKSNAFVSPPLGAYKTFKAEVGEVTSGTTVTFRNLEDLEIERIQLHISDKQWKMSALEYGFSPWVINPIRLMDPASNNCILCGSEVEPEIPRVFGQSVAFPRRLCSCNQTECIDKLPVCINCNDEAAFLSAQTARIQSAFSPDLIENPFSNTKFNCDLQAPAIVSGPPHALVVERSDATLSVPQEIISEDGGEWKTKSGTNFVTVANNFPTEIEHIEITAERDKGMNVMIMDESGTFSEMIFGSFRNGTLWFGSSVHIVTKIITLLIMTEEETIIRKLKIFGIPALQLPSIAGKCVGKTSLSPPKSKFKLAFEPTQFRHIRRGSFPAGEVNIAITVKNYVNRSLQLCLYDSGGLIASEEVELPFCELGLKLIYEINAPRGFTTILVLYNEFRQAERHHAIYYYP